MKKIYILSVLSTLILISCQKVPSSSFTHDGIYKVNEEISFTNTSRNAHSYKWNFGDGDTSIVESPTHVYTWRDTYHIHLTTYSKNGRKENTYHTTCFIDTL